MRYSIRAYRKIRKRNMQDCIQDAIDLFSALAEKNELIFKWKNTGSSKKKALIQPFLELENREVVEKLIKKGRNRNDFDGEYIQELGFSIFLWNGESSDDLRAKISVLNGSYSEYVTNSLCLDFPEFGSISTNDLLAQSMIEIAVNAIDADWAVLYRDDMDFSVGQGPFLDRALFLTNDAPTDTRRVEVFQSSADHVYHHRNGKVFLKSM